MKNQFIFLATLVIQIGLIACNQTVQDTSVKNPNIIFIMADDMGYGDLGCYGQQVIKTPHIDSLVLSGIRFTNFYSGSPVCAPARSVLMTGQHTGHTTVRGNFGKGGVEGLGGGQGRVPLKADDVTVAEILKGAGYVTGITGKWGLGEPGTSGLPNDQGFDEWFGFLNQRRAHDHYNEYIWRNKEKFNIPENEGEKEGKYTHHMFTDFALDFIEKNAGQNQPFFLYLPYLLPHSDYEIPEINALYRDQNWTEEEKIHASMITLIDTDVGKIVSLLREKSIEENTLIFLTSDNGAARRWEGTFNSSGKLKGRKRDVYEGGIRVPMIVSMPGTVPRGEVNHTVGYFADILPTFNDFAKKDITQPIDGISLKEVFLSNETIENERILYWEFHEQGGKQAVRMGNWKGLRLEVHEKGFHDDLELYDLTSDPSETQNVADQHPDIVEKIKQIMLEEHTLSDNFPFRFEEEEGI